MAEPRHIRIGILCQGTTLPRWQARSIRHLLELKGVELVVVGSPGEGLRPNERPSEPMTWFEKRCLALMVQEAMQPEDLTDPLSLVPGVELGPDLGSAFQTLAGHSPDLVVSFLPGIGLGENAMTNGLPIWEFRFGGGQIGISGSPNWQTKFLEQRSMLVQLASPGQVTLEASFPLRTGSDQPTLDSVLLGAAWLPAALIPRLRAGAWSGLGSSLIKPGSTSGDQSSIFGIFRSWAGLEWRRTRGQGPVDGPGGDWNIGVLYQPISSLLEEEASMNVRWLPAPSDGNQRMESFGYYADDQLNVLYTKDHRDKEFAQIARLRPKNENVLKRSRTMLSTEAPLNYPYVVHRPDGNYVVVNYAHQGRTELFKVAQTNDGLDHIKILLNRPLTNASLFEFEGRWWLFGTDPDAQNSVLLGFHSDRFDGPFEPHDLNPLKINEIGTLPAGTPFLRNGELWRPASDLSDPDVPVVILNRVHSLTPSTFIEEAGKRISGFPGSVYAKGVRTLCAMGDLTLIDGSRGSVVEKTEKEPKHRHRGRKSKRG